MPRAIKGTYKFPLQHFPFPLIRTCKINCTKPGVLIECDPSIKAIILKIDHERHDYIVEDLDDQTLVIKESQLQRLKARLEEVRHLSEDEESHTDLPLLKELASTQQMPDDNSEDD